MSFGKPYPTICLDDILNRFDELEILKRYLGITTVPTLINSPLRKDNNASLSIFLNSTGNVLFKDFGTFKSYNLWSFLMELWGVSYTDMLYRIYSEIKDCPITVNSVRKTTKKINLKNIKLQCRVRDWKDYDLAFWRQYGINLDWLKFGNIYPISDIFINKNDTTFRFAAEKYAYTYIENKDNKITLKIYQPYSKTRKWINNNDSSVWDLWSNLPPKGDILIITSSRKDALSIWSTTLIPAISMQGEGYIPKQKIIDELKGRFGKIFIFFDNDFSKEDNPGRTYAKHLSKLFDIPYIEIPDEYKEKDPSDFIKHYGVKEFKKLLNTLII